MAHPANPLLQRPLYVFDLPEELLYTLQLKIQPTAAPPSPSPSPSPRTPTPTEPPSNPTDSHDAAPTTATSCNLCSLTFPTLQDQKSHVRSDLHNYNLKQKMRGRPAVSEAEFEKLVGELDESISGSDSTDSEDSAGEDEVNGGAKGKDTTLSALLKRQAKVTDGDANDAPVRKKRGAGTPPLIWFSSTKLPENTSLGVYRAIFSSQEQANENQLVQTIQRKQLSAKSVSKSQKPQPKLQKDDGGVPLPAPIQQKTEPHYFLCMLGGGHFAAMLVSLTPTLTRKNGLEDRTATVLAHKTFHRYTTRRKQGGSQSANDNAKGNAHSAGSSIRRHNEAALTQEVRALLQEWREWIESAELWFVRATGSTNRRTLFGPYEGQVLQGRDERVRGFPFSTRRATQAELMRAFVELTRVKVSTIDEAALAAQQQEREAEAAKAEAAANGKATPSQKKATKPSKEDETAALHTTQLQALIRRSKAPALVSYIQSNSLPPDFRFFPPEQNHHAPTPLHLAATSHSPACVTALLVKAGAEPGVRNAEGKSAFEIVGGDRGTRDAFRLARSQLGEEEWEWDAAGVPAAITQADVEARVKHERAEKDAENEVEKARRAKEVERLRAEDAEKRGKEKEKAFGKGNLLGKPTMTAEERRAEEARGMSEEMRVRLEREKRARAAEERMKRLQGGS